MECIKLLETIAANKETIKKLSDEIKDCETMIFKVFAESLGITLGETRVRIKGGSNRIGVILVDNHNAYNKIDRYGLTFKFLKKDGTISQHNAMSDTYALNREYFWNSDTPEEIMKKLEINFSNVEVIKED